jgi:hypothetical protein
MRHSELLLHLILVLSVIMPIIIYAEYHTLVKHAESLYAECRCAECRGAMASSCRRT